MISKNIISTQASLMDALNAINSLGSNETLTLFIVNDLSVLCGTLTDGDIRRSLINGISLTTLAIESANKHFLFLQQGNDNINILKEARTKGIELIPVINSDKHIIDIINLKTHKSYLPIDAVLMAGGKGGRLRPLTETTPKPLLKVGDKAIIVHNIDRLIQYGIKHINVTVNYLKEQIEDHFSKPINGIKINTVREPKFLGTMGSVQFIERFFNDTILLMNSDLFTNIEYEDFYLHFLDNNADMSIAAVPYTVSIPYGIFDLDGRNVKGILEKPTFNYYANSGIYLIKRDLLKLIPEDQFFNATDFIELLIKNNYNVIRYPLNGTWIDIGNQQEYQKVQDLLKQ